MHGYNHAWYLNSYQKDQIAVWHREWFIVTYLHIFVHCQKSPPCTYRCSCPQCQHSQHQHDSCSADCWHTHPHLQAPSHLIYTTSHNYVSGHTVWQNALETFLVKRSLLLVIPNAHNHRDRQEFEKIALTKILEISKHVTVLATMTSFAVEIINVIYIITFTNWPLFLIKKNMCAVY